MKISLIHATRAGADPISPRAPRTAALAESRYKERMASASGRSDIEIEYIYSVDEDDPVSIDMVLRSEAKHVICRKGTKWGDRFCHVNALNQGAAEATGDILLQCDDDILAPLGWDALIVDRLNENVDGEWSIPAVLGVGDPHFEGGEYSGDGMIGSFVMTRGAYNKWGYFVYPEYDGMQGDIDFTQKCALDGMLIDAYSSIYFRHFWHGGMDDAQRDAVHDRHMSHESHQIGYMVP